MNQRINARNKEKGIKPGMGSLSCWIARIPMWAAGLGIIALSAFTPIFRDSEGTITGEFVFALSTALAFVILGAGFCGRYKIFTFWLSCGIFGHAAALQAIDAGGRIHYQHFFPPGVLAVEKPWVLIALAVQAVLVGLGIARRRMEIHGWLSERFRVWQLTVIIFVIIFSSAALSPTLGLYFAELVFAAALAFINLGNLVLVVWALPGDVLVSMKGYLERSIGLKQSPEEAGSSLDRLAFIGAVWVFCVTALLSFFVYQRHPHIPDEVLYLFQARYMAAGKLSIPAAPVPQAFSFYLLPYQSERWYSIFPPGWPAVLAAGVRIGIPWLVNPILAGLNILLVYRLVSIVYERRTATWTILLLCISPWYLFVGMNLMSHTLALTLSLVSLTALIVAVQRPSTWYAALSGMAVGALSLVRPYDALIFGLIILVWAIFASRDRLKISYVLLFITGAAVVAGLVLPYNNGVLGSAIKFPLQSYYSEYYGPKVNAIGFGPERGLGWALDAFPGHSPFEALVNASLNIFSVNIELFGWGMGSLILLTVFIVNEKYTYRDWLMIGIVVGIIALYSLYWFSGGPDFGARYWYLVIVPLSVLTVRGAEILSEKTGEDHPGSIPGIWWVFAGIFIASAITVINYLPWRAVDKYYHYLDMRPDVRKLAEENHFGNSLVLVQGKDHPDYASAWVYNPLDYSTEAPIFAWDKNQETRRQLLEAFPERDVWILQGPSLSGSGYRIIEGPLEAEQVPTYE